MNKHSALISAILGGGLLAACATTAGGSGANPVHRLSDADYDRAMARAVHFQPDSVEKQAYEQYVGSGQTTTCGTAGHDAKP